jgi:hypothetical protein
MRWWHWSVLGLVVAFTLVVEQSISSDHEYWFTAIPGFWVGFGFVGCVAIIVLSKWYGRHAVQRGEDYYEQDDGSEDGDREEP